jgi:hypothetical protein
MEKFESKSVRASDVESPGIATRERRDSDGVYATEK